LGSVPRSIKEPFNTNDVNVGGFVKHIVPLEKNGVNSLFYASFRFMAMTLNVTKREDVTGNRLHHRMRWQKADELYADVFQKFTIFLLSVSGILVIFGPRQILAGLTLPYTAFKGCYANNNPSSY